MKKIKALLVFTCLLLVIFSSSLIVGKEILFSNNTIYVDDSGGYNFKEIQEAIAAANPGDTIYVYNGEYSRISVNKKLTITGESNIDTIIYANNNEILADKVSFTNFHLKGKETNLDNILVIKGNDILVSDCNMYPTDSIKPLNGIEIEASKDVTIRNCDVKWFDYWGITISCLADYTSCENIFIENCEIAGSYRGGYIMGDYGNNFVFRDCTIYDCGIDDISPGAGILMGGVFPVLIENCIFYHNTIGINVNCQSNCVIKDCIIYDNDVGIELRNYYYPMTNVENNTFYSNSISYNDIGINVGETCYDNLFYHNDLVENSFYNAYDDGLNSWDNGYPSGGNYWSDYTGEDPDGDGIGNSAYIIPGLENVDRCPLMTKNKNLPPFKPEKPNGPTDGNKKQEYSFSTKVFDHDENKLYYKFSWGNNEYSNWLGPVNSGDTITKSHSWTVSGRHNIKVKVKDIHGLESDWSDPAKIKMSYPEKPTINGPTTGSPGKEYEYIITAKDPDDDDLYYRIVWDDDWSVSWVGPYKSGEEIILKKTFKERGQHRLDVGVKDYEEVIGEYNSLIIIMPKEKSYPQLFKHPFYNFLINLCKVSQFLLKF